MWSTALIESVRDILQVGINIKLIGAYRITYCVAKAKKSLAILKSIKIPLKAWAVQFFF